MAPLPVEADSRSSFDSLSSVSTTSLVLERLHQHADGDPGAAKDAEKDVDDDAETGPFLGPPGVPLQNEPMDRGLRRILLVTSVVFAVGWLVALVVFVASGSYRHASDADHDPDASSRGSAKAITMDQVFSGFWMPHSHSISWIADPDGRDGLLLEKGVAGKDYLVVEDVRANSSAHDAAADAADAVALAKPRTLMKTPAFEYAGKTYTPDWLEPSPDLTKVLIGVDRKKNWRYSFSASYFILDVASATAQPLIPDKPAARVQLASWIPRSDAVAFTMDNNLYMRRLAAGVVQITSDGGPELFYGVPDWVFEEEVFSDRRATWWSADGQFLAYLRTNETAVGEFPIEYYLSRPSGTQPPGREAYPETRRIKYPKPGSHNPVVKLEFYDVARGDSFAVPVAGDFADDDRIINNVVWAGAAQVLVKATNRVGDHVRVVVVDVAARTASVVSDVDVARLDGGWYEVAHRMTFVPADAARGRPHDGYVDTVIHDGFEHLAYFSPLNSSRPVMLTSGPWDVDDAPAAVDPANNLVYFVAARESSVQRHVYSVRLDGSGLRPLTDTAAEAYYDVSFSARAGFALLSYRGPRVPFQKLVSTPSAPGPGYERLVEDNALLADRARRHALPLLRFGTLDVGDGARVNYVERRPPHFDAARRHPVLFHQYSGPGSQSVSKRFAVDFQAYVAAALGYVVVTVDPRGTGFRGRRHRVAVRGRLGLVEAADHIAAARAFAARPYVDPARLAIWGWSYGGFAALKTLEQDACATFSYGVAVAPVTDWRFYDSVYTERYMRTPAANAAGYDASRVANASALARCPRFLVMHGTADDNVHLQNSLALLDALDLEAAENYDVHVFPDSDHSIAFHGANRIVYDKINNWLINAFNGEWLKTAHPKPVDSLRRS